MHSLATRLFPICRSLTGDGVRTTLKILREVVPLKVVEVPSGTRVFDWTIPDEWNVRDAYIKDGSGRRVVDFKKNNLHLVGYSVPFHGRMSLDELRPNLHSLPRMPGAIPYVTSYYARRWGFCLAHRELKRLRRGTYEVKVDTTLAPGALTYAELLVPGRSDSEVLVSTYVCHPSMANNELSGPVVAAFLARSLLDGPRPRLSYRFVFVPESIGSITYISRNLDHLRRKTVAGYVVTCVGDPGGFSYLRTRSGDLMVDRLTEHVLRNSGARFKTYDFTTSGSDERQYGAPGVDLPVGSLMRTKYGHYRQYHTSLDDLSLVTPRGLEGSLEMYTRCVAALEANRILARTNLCDPQLGRRGLYPNLSTPSSITSAVFDMVNTLAYCDGTNDLLAVAERLGRPIEALAPIVDDLTRAGLLVERG